MKLAACIATTPLPLPSPAAAAPYVLHLTPLLSSSSSDLVASTSSSSLFVLDPSTLRPRPPSSSSSSAAVAAVHRTHVNSELDGGGSDGALTCLECGPRGSGAVFTAGRDGVVRRWDLRLGSGRSVWEVADANKAPLLSLACGTDGVAAGTELRAGEAVVQTWDCRARARPLVRYVECHNDDVTELAYHPTRSSILLSGSTDGLVNLYDSTVASEDDALLQVFNHGAPVAHAGFLEGGTMYALSHDERFALYRSDDHTDAEDGGAAATDFGDLRERLACEYVVDVLPVAGDGAVIGAGSHSTNRLELIPLASAPTWHFGAAESVRLDGAHGEDVVRAVHIDDETQTIFTGAEDGLVRAWRTPRREEEEEEEERPAAEAKVGPERRKGKGNGNGNGKAKGKGFRPY